MNYTPAEELRNLCCQACGKILSVGPVFLTSDGKNICGRCPSPSKDALRNYLYEEVVSKLAFPCIYDGCTEIIRWQNVKNHEENCSYKPFSCLEKQCIWQGNKADLSHHFKKEHPYFCLDDKDEFELDLSKGQQATLLDYLANIPFVINILYDEPKDLLGFTIFHIGKVDDINEWSLIVKIRNEEGMTLKQIVKEIFKFGDVAGPQNSASFPHISSFMVNSKAFCSFKLKHGEDKIKSKALKGLQKIKCNLCKNLITDGVHICKEHHMICKNCKCSCQQPFQYVDVYGFQHIGDDIFFPCSHKECPHAYRKPEIERHINECVFRHFKCEKCEYFGKFSDLVSHCCSKHDAKMTNDFKWFANLNNEKRKVVMIAEDYIFYFTREIQRNSSLDYYITFEVKKHSVINEKKFKYRIELKNHRDNFASPVLEGKELESGFIGGFIVKYEDMANFLDENNEIFYRITILTNLSFQ